MSVGSGSLFDVRRHRALVFGGELVRVGLRFQVRRLLDQHGRKLRVGGGLGVFEKRRRLAREVESTQHDVSPQLVTNCSNYAGTGISFPKIVCRSAQRQKVPAPAGSRNKYVAPRWSMKGRTRRSGRRRS